MDNIVKMIIDGMNTMIYPDDRLLERIIVQNFERGIWLDFHSPMLTLVQAFTTDLR